MTSRIGDIVIDCRDPQVVATFWCAALGYRIVGSDASGVAVAGDPSWIVMEDPGGNEFCVMDVVLPPEPEPFHAG